MADTIIVTDAETLRATIDAAVQQAIAQQVPAAIQEANAPDWLTGTAVEQRYGLSANQLTYMRGKASVEYTQHGRRILYKRESVERWIDEGRVTPKVNGNGRGNH